MSDVTNPIRIISTAYRKIQEIRFLTKNTFIIRIERNNMQFIPGQHVIVGLRGSLDQESTQSIVVLRMIILKFW
jgi:NAD(P)H-flavin reductase